MYILGDLCLSSSCSGVKWPRHKQSVNKLRSGTLEVTKTQCRQQAVQSVDCMDFFFKSDTGYGHSKAGQREQSEVAVARQRCEQHLENKDGTY